MDVTNAEGHEPQFMTVEPNWSMLFNFASQLVKDEVAVDRGQELILEMLAYGKRLHDKIKE